jgi:hypothetical protein
MPKYLNQSKDIGLKKVLELLDDWKKSNKKQSVPKPIAPDVVYKHDNETYELDNDCKDDDLELSDAENLFKR